MIKNNSKSIFKTRCAISIGYILTCHNACVRVYVYTILIKKDLLANLLAQLIKKALFVYTHRIVFSISFISTADI